MNDTARPIGYYVHHHGDGHRQRALAIAPHMRDRVVLLGTGLTGRCGEIPSVDLPDDRLGDGFDGRDGADARPRSLHYAPVDHDGVRRRVAAMTDWIASMRPALIVVDVSVEIAMLARLASVPTVFVRLSGDRTDAPHRQAFAAARALLCPFHADLDEPRQSPSVRAKTIYAPGLTRRCAGSTPDSRLILVVLGRGGAIGDGDRWAAAAARMPERRWRVIGAVAMPAAKPDNLDFAGWIDEPEREIAAAGIVIGAAGDGVVGAVLAHRRPFLCLPEDRPFDEQKHKARALANAGAAIVSETLPDPREWRSLIARAERLDMRAAAYLDDPDGARQAAVRLLALADLPG